MSPGSLQGVMPLHPSITEHRRENVKIGLIQFQLSAPKTDVCWTLIGELLVV